MSIKTRSCYASLSKVKCSASSQATSMLFKSWRMISFQFFLGLPDPRLVALISQDMACFRILSSFILNTCPNHLSLLCLMISSNAYWLVLFLHTGMHISHLFFLCLCMSGLSVLGLVALVSKAVSPSCL